MISVSYKYEIAEFASFSDILRKPRRIGFCIFGAASLALGIILEIVFSLKDENVLWLQVLIITLMAIGLFCLLQAFTLTTKSALGRLNKNMNFALNGFEDSITIDENETIFTEKTDSTEQIAKTKNENVVSVVIFEAAVYFTVLPGTALLLPKTKFTNEEIDKIKEIFGKKVVCKK